MNEVKDKYDIAIEYLRANPDKVFKAWQEPHGVSDEIKQAHCLFQYVTPNGEGKVIYRDGEVVYFGCLTQVKQGQLDDEKYIAWTPELTKMIVEDERIPHNATVDTLEVFAEYQRMLDKTIRVGH